MLSLFTLQEKNEVVIIKEVVEVENKKVRI